MFMIPTAKNHYSFEFYYLEQHFQTGWNSNFATQELKLLTFKFVRIKEPI